MLNYHRVNQSIESGTGDSPPGGAPAGAPRRARPGLRGAQARRLAGGLGRHGGEARPDGADGGGLGKGHEMWINHDKDDDDDDDDK